MSGFPTRLPNKLREVGTGHPDPEMIRLQSRIPISDSEFLKNPKNPYENFRSSHSKSRIFQTQKRIPSFANSKLKFSELSPELFKLNLDLGSHIFPIQSRILKLSIQIMSPKPNNKIWNFNPKSRNLKFPSGRDLREFNLECRPLVTSSMKSCHRI